MSKVNRKRWSKMRNKNKEDWGKDIFRKKCTWSFHLHTASKKLFSFLFMLCLTLISQTQFNKSVMIFKNWSLSLSLSLFFCLSLSLALFASLCDLKMKMTKKKQKRLWSVALMINTIVLFLVFYFPLYIYHSCLDLLLLLFLARFHLRLLFTFIT